MKSSGGLKEGNVVIGNFYNKYASSNPLIKGIMNNFLRNLGSIVEDVSPDTIHEIGCGEGFITLRFKAQGRDARGSDFSEQVIRIARENAIELGVSPDIFSIKSIYDLTPQHDKADLIVCCEVLEHLKDPVSALQVLREIATDYVILSVPREPLWRFLNMMRGKYVIRMGNTPGHIQHWSTSSFIDLVKPFFIIEKVFTPLPWIMLLCKKTVHNS